MCIALSGGYVLLRGSDPHTPKSVGFTCQSTTLKSEDPHPLFRDHKNYEEIAEWHTLLVIGYRSRVLLSIKSNRNLAFGVPFVSNTAY